MTDRHAPSGEGSGAVGPTSKIGLAGGDRGLRGSAISAAASWRERAELLRALVTRDLRLLYARSALGLLWSAAHPAALVVFYALLLGPTLRPGVENHYLFVLAGLLPWLWFSGSVGQAVGVFPANGSILRQSAFPAELLVVSTITSQFIHFLINLAILLPLLAARESIGAQLLALPVLLGLQGAFTLGVALAVSTGNAIWRDVGHAAGVALRAWFLATPILYEGARLHGPLEWWLMLNPMAALTEGYQAVLYRGELPGAASLARATLAAALSLAAGAAVYAALRHRVPEEL